MAHDALVGNASDPQQIRKGRTTEKKRRDRALADIRAVLKTGEGRRVLWRLMVHCSAFDSIYDANSIAMAHKAGKQDVGHKIMHDIEAADPSAFFTMMQETSQQT